MRSCHPTRGTYPAAGFLAMVIEAAVRRTDGTGAVKRVTLREVTANAALIVSVNVDPEIVVVLRPYFDGRNTTSNNWLEFTISCSTHSEGLRKNCSGLVRTEYDPSGRPLAGELLEADGAVVALPYSRLNESCKVRKTNEEFYNLLAGVGLEYGEEFAKLDDIEHSPRHGVAKLNIACLRHIMALNPGLDRISFILLLSTPAFSLHFRPCWTRRTLSKTPWYLLESKS